MDLGNQSVENLEALVLRRQGPRLRTSLAAAAIRSQRTGVDSPAASNEAKRIQAAECAVLERTRPAGS